MKLQLKMTFHTQGQTISENMFLALDNRERLSTSTITRAELK